MLELWHEWNSVHSFKVRVVLAEKRLDWVERRLELLKFEHLRPEYLRLNPNGVVPTRVHDGRVVLESSVICQYLDEAFPARALMPADPVGRAHARAWLKYFDDAVHPKVRRVGFALLYTPLLRSLAPAELEARLASHPQPRRAQLCAPYPRALGWLRRVLERPSVVRAAAPGEFRFPSPPAGLLEQLLKGEN